MDETTLKKLGIKIGHYTDKENLTGTTAFISEKGAYIGIDIRGSNTATINTPAFGPTEQREITNSVVLTGGSVWGMESAIGVANYLEETNIGSLSRAGIIPGITGAVIFDIAVGNRKVRPTKENGYQATKAASYQNLGQGNIGVGTGATTGKWFKGKHLKGGFGMGVTHLPNDIIVGAFVVTNSVGDIVNPKTGEFYCEKGNYDLEDLAITEDLTKLVGLMDLQPQNTTLAVIATNVALEKNQLIKIAGLTHDGMARAVFPVHTMMDGDVVFAMSSLDGERKTLPDALSMTLTDVIALAAQDALMKAIKNSLLHAESIEGFPAFTK